MKTVLRFFGLIFALISLLTCSMSIYRAQLDKEKLTENQAKIVDIQNQMAKLKTEVKIMSGESKLKINAEIKKLEKIIDSLPTATNYTVVQVILSLLLILSLTFSVLMFKTNLDLSDQLFYTSVILTILAFFASPDLDRDQYSTLPSRTLALLSGIPVVIVGYFAICVTKKPLAYLNFK
ncbi:hypothetical protein [Flavobacterium mekongense]|uniref:hypothetical protein n=1 Tax=Flavobacterium mekongense TaxID=3379707 RepID=UPI00399B9064